MIPFINKNILEKMNSDLQTELYHWLKKNHHGKLAEYSVYRHQKILDLMLNWMLPEDKSGLSFDQLKETRTFKWMDLYFSRFEFIPLSDWSDELEQKEIYAKLHYSPIAISISTERGHFKVFIVKKDSESSNLTTLNVYKMTKHKFKILDDDSIHDLTGNRYFTNYEEMRKFLINHSRDIEPSMDPKVSKLKEIKSKIMSTNSSPISDNFIIDHFSKSSVSSKIKINFTNGSLLFASYPFRLWSNTVSMMMDDFSNLEELDLQIPREIFVLYSVFRISNFFKIKISMDIFKTLSKTIPDFPVINEDFSKDFILQHLIELYQICDFLEDKKALMKLIDLFRESKLDKYEKQNFYDLLFQQKIGNKNV
jgi:hypothetical protein